MFNLINACTDLGVHIDGSDKGPLEISKYLNNDKINDRYFVRKTNCIKSKNHDNLKKNFKEVNIFTKELFEIVNSSLKNNIFPIIIGGDHTVAIASILASQNHYDDIGILWIDAHTDFNTFETTETGNIHGLPLAACCGLCLPLTDFITKKYVNPKNCVIVGARSIDKEEMNNLKKAGVNIFTTNDLKNEGIEKIMDQAFSLLPKKIHVSYDLDVIDPIYAPGVSIDEECGIDVNEAYSIMDYLVKKKDIFTSLDLVEYNPSLDKNDKTLTIALNLLNKFLDE